MATLVRIESALNDRIQPVSLSGYAEALAQWAQWARRLKVVGAQTPGHGATDALQECSSWHYARTMVDAYALVTANAPVSILRWHAPVAFVESFMAMSKAEAGHFHQIYRDSKGRLSPLSDPLDVAFPLHRQLSSSREEVYSDWLQWVLMEVADSRLIGRILGSSSLERFGNSLEQIHVDREVCIAHGHLDQTGRLDVVITQGTKWLAAIEVKTQKHSEPALQKHKGYRDSIHSADTELIFLSVNPPDSDLFGFRFLSWADVCVALRGIAPHRLGSKQILGTAMILAFVGAVEQNLLGFSSPETSSLSIGKIPHMVDHLAKAQRTETTHGNS